MLLGDIIHGLGLWHSDRQLKTGPLVAQQVNSNNISCGIAVLKEYLSLCPPVNSNLRAPLGTCGVDQDQCQRAYWS